MPRLKSRQRPIPNGFVFYEPLTKRKWTGPALSFDMLVQEIIAHRMGNAILNGKATDYATVADEVDTANALYCQRMGWTQYVLHDGIGVTEVKKKPAPSRPTPRPANAGAEGAPNKSIARAAITLTSILGPSQKPVARELAEKRAAICVRCPLNQTGQESFRAFLSEAGASMVRKMFGFLNDANLKTTRDEELGICGACECPLKMKVHAPLDFILSKTDAETMAAFAENCWIRTGDKL